ncbi:MAG: hypothetical protein J6571_01210 [Snodgrassella sp.]|nr:hypothetical protein [Snodgrassella sp.]MCO6521796.1 hypothetical protein [Snodgrassella sp.]
MNPAENLLIALTYAAPQNYLRFCGCSIYIPESEIWLLLATGCVVHLNQ